MPEYVAQFADVLAQTRQPGSPFTPEDAAALLKSAASAGLVLLGHPGGVLGLTPGQLTASATAAGHLSETAARAVTRKKTGEISRQEYDLLADPARELTRRVAVAVRSVAERVPLVVAGHGGSHRRPRLGVAAPCDDADRSPGDLGSRCSLRNRSRGWYRQSRSLSSCGRSATSTWC